MAKPITSFVDRLFGVSQGTAPTPTPTAPPPAAPPIQSPSGSADTFKNASGPSFLAAAAAPAAGNVQGSKTLLGQ